ncbi:hypothetical protein PBT90_14000 [Algoriphagus halophytocola]|uniref:Glycoside hydrolase n=1 Tax=Algoriphagus halophytocola TaxID=2991499 RepID=A0ABY6MPQ1_9BACT|nr:MULTISPECIES: hypothetical protein [unclassified Algoriphagus]UZD24502.1 hypothetical protein OM944_08355 [Algoriphagus sp. TR-M5]WBL41866.1 hypothetical protein PBT90_14000 [Algoriphagus sp. TR-M9]
MIFKKLSMLCFFLVIASMTAYAQSDITGKWKTTLSGPQGEMELTFNYKVENGALTGTIASQMGEIPLENGKVDGSKFSYDFAIQDMTVSHKGEVVSTDELKVVSQRGEMKLTRVEE